VIEVRRTFDAPRALVWAAWTDPAQTSGLVGRRGWHIDPTTPILDVRPGGRLHHVSVHEQTGERMTIDGVFDEVVQGGRLSFTHADARSVATFTKLGDGRTELVVRSDQRMSDALRRQAIAGMGSAFDRLADHLQHNLASSTHEHVHPHGHRRRVRDDLDV
jgi:uncharacterized protein YndB with AHSA1/START domain